MAFIVIAPLYLCILITKIFTLVLIWCLFSSNIFLDPRYAFFAQRKADFDYLVVVYQ